MYVCNRIIRYHLLKAIAVLLFLVLIPCSMAGVAEEESSDPPLDSTRANIQEGVNFNLAILAIKGWQKISFATPLFNCPFEPCCSNYAIHAFTHEGFFKGIIYTADRISRCHPAALKYYPERNGSLVNEWNTESYFKSEHLPYLTIPLSLVIPGFNKMVNGRFYDGLSIFLLTEISAYGAYKTYHKGSYFCIPFTFIFLSFYISDIYFNFHSL